MTNEKDLVKTILKDDINLVITHDMDSSYDTTAILTNVINEVAIKDNKKVLYVTSPEEGIEDREWYMANLVSLISGIDVTTTLAYLCPFSNTLNAYDRKEVNKLPNSNKFIEALEKIKNSNLEIISTAYNSDPLYFIFDDQYSKESYDLIIIKNFDLIEKFMYFKNDKYNENSDMIYSDMIKLLENYTRKHHAKIVCVDWSMFSYSKNKFFENYNIVHVSTTRDNRTYNLFNGSEITLDDTNKIIEYEPKNSLIYDTFNNLFIERGLVAIGTKNKKFSSSIINLLNKYLFNRKTQIKFCDFSEDDFSENDFLKKLYEYENYPDFDWPDDEEILDYALSFIDDVKPYDYYIINDLETMAKRTKTSIKDLCVKLYQFSKFEHTKVMILSLKDNFEDNLSETYQELFKFVNYSITLSDYDDIEFYFTCSPVTCLNDHAKINKEKSKKFIFKYKDEEIHE